MRKNYFNIWEESNPEKKVFFKSTYRPSESIMISHDEFGIGYYGNEDNEISLLKILKVKEISKENILGTSVEFDFVRKLNLTSRYFKSLLPENVAKRNLINFANINFFKLFPEINEIVLDSRNKLLKNIFFVNSILFGPPGTGKTYESKIKSISIINNIIMEKRILTKEEKENLDKEFEKLSNSGRIKFITFHPSYSYEDFIEGIRPDIKSKEVKFVLKNGIFKKLCLSALKEYDENNELDSWDDYKDKLKAQIDENTKSKRNDNSINKFVLIIDEINRGDISKIFGELITLIEEDKRIGGDNQITVQLPYSENKFGIPPNLYIVGTMNTADRSLALLDIALRRRFDFIEMVPDYQQLKKDPKAFGITIDMKLLEPSITALENINNFLGDNPDIGKDKKIGHAYFCNIDDESKINNIWKNKILPLMEEYYFFDKDTLEKISGGNYDLSSGWKLDEIDNIIIHFSKIKTING